MFRPLKGQILVKNIKASNHFTNPSIRIGVNTKKIYNKDVGCENDAVDLVDTN